MSTSCDFFERQQLPIVFVAMSNAVYSVQDKLRNSIILKDRWPKMTDILLRQSKYRLIELPDGHIGAKSYQETF